MAKFLVPLANGVYESQNLQKIGSDNPSFYHQISFDIKGSLTSGSLAIEAKAPDSSSFEAVPSGVIDLTAPVSLLFQFNAESYRFTVSDSDALDGKVLVSDQEFKGF